MKKEGDGKTLAGATIGLFLADGAEPILATVSAEDGSFSLTGIPYGEHVVREIAVPEGYVMDETPYAVKVDQNGAVVEIVITNKLILKLEVNVAVNHVFFSFAFGFGSKVKIKASENVKAQYKRMIEQAASHL